MEISTEMLVYEDMISCNDLAHHDVANCFYIVPPWILELMDWKWPYNGMIHPFYGLFLM